MLAYMCPIKTLTSSPQLQIYGIQSKDYIYLGYISCIARAKVLLNVTNACLKIVYLLDTQMSILR
jgi:hypothetical protein